MWNLQVWRYGSSQWSHLTTSSDPYRGSYNLRFVIYALKHRDLQRYSIIIREFIGGISQMSLTTWKFRERRQSTVKLDQSLFLYLLTKWRMSRWTSQCCTRIFCCQISYRVSVLITFDLFENSSYYIRLRKLPKYIMIFTTDISIRKQWPAKSTHCCVVR